MWEKEGRNDYRDKNRLSEEGRAWPQGDGLPRDKGRTSEPGGRR